MHSTIVYEENVIKVLYSKGDLDQKDFGRKPGCLSEEETQAAGEGELPAKGFEGGWPTGVPVRGSMAWWYSLKLLVIR